MITLILQFSLVVSAKSFELPVLPQAKKPTYDINDVSEKMSYYEFVRSTLGPKMQKMADLRHLDNEAELTAGRGVSVRLSQNNYNVHVNFPNAAVGGRSYGWTLGQIGDWSDAMYLDRLSEVTEKESERDLFAFYELIIQMVGACNASGIDALAVETQHVAANFLAIYTAEAYRAMVPDAHKNWDDALMEVTLLSAFHSGQNKLMKFYLGRFSDESKKQNSGVYAKYKPGPLYDKARSKNAELRDYWQFSANPESKQSGINITRVDFEKMGEAITKYERRIARNQNLDKIFAVVGGDRDNVIKAISQFFSQGRSKDLSKIDQLAEDVAQFLMDVHADADKITDWEKRGER